MNIYSVVHKDF